MRSFIHASISLCAVFRMSGTSLSASCQEFSSHRTFRSSVGVPAFSSKALKPEGATSKSNSEHIMKNGRQNFSMRDACSISFMLRSMCAAVPARRPRLRSLSVSSCARKSASCDVSVPNGTGEGMPGHTFRMRSHMGKTTFQFTHVSSLGLTIMAGALSITPPVTKSLNSGNRAIMCTAKRPAPLWANKKSGKPLCNCATYLNTLPKSWMMLSTDSIKPGTPLKPSLLPWPCHSGK
mmetsp:Transcript_24513/g.56499  ORF Transcript_24513/g.56499 Transcript_24513/m.56499 type:complete len:236 (-) Transcript_24513:285-992(-)